MMCYKDMTFCKSVVERHTCGRELTDEHIKAADRLGLPICWGILCEDGKDAV